MELLLQENEQLHIRNHFPSNLPNDLNLPPINTSTDSKQL